MHVVIFEVEPKAELAQDYFDLAAKLRPELEKLMVSCQLSDSPA